MPESFTLTKNTVVPISLSILIAVITSVYFVTTALNRVTNRLSAVEKAIVLRWSYPMARETWKEFQRLNPDVVIPKLDEIKKAHTVE